MKKLFVLFLALTCIFVFSTIAIGMNIAQYIQLHQVNDGGYLDTPTVVSRYGDLTQTIYMQKLAKEHGEKFVSPLYFTEYLSLLKEHSTYFKASTWINYSAELSKYFIENGEEPDQKLLKALDVFLIKNLNNYAESPSYYQILADGLSISKMLNKENTTKTDIYKAATDVLKKSLSGHLYANAGLTVLAALIENGLPLGKLEGIQQFVSSNLSYLQGEYRNDFYLYKAGFLSKQNLQDILKNADVETPFQLYWYTRLCDVMNIKKSVKLTYENLEKNRAPFGGFYALGNYSSVRDTYWATKVLELLGLKTTTKKYWENFVSNLIQTEYAYPVNVLAKYIYYVFNINDEYHLLTQPQLESLEKALTNKLNVSPALTAYYLATFKFNDADESLRIVQRINYRGSKYYSDVNTVLTRLFNGLQKIDKSKRDISYYYDYVRLLNFAREFGYAVNSKNVEEVEKNFLENMKKAPYVDLNLLEALLNLETNYNLTVNRSFFISNIEKLHDKSSGGYFYNTLDGRVTFQSIYTANKILDSLKQ